MSSSYDPHFSPVERDELIGALKANLKLGNQELEELRKEKREIELYKDDQFMKILLEMFYDWKSGNFAPKPNLRSEQRGAKLVKKNLENWWIRLKDALRNAKEHQKIRDVLQDLQEELNLSKSINPFVKSLRPKSLKLQDLVLTLYSGLIGVLSKKEKTFFHRTNKSTPANNPKDLDLLLTYVCVYGRKQKNCIAENFIKELLDLTVPLGTPDEEAKRVRKRFERLMGYFQGLRKENGEYRQLGMVLLKKKPKDKIEDDKTQFFSESDKVFWNFENLPELFSSLTLLVSLWVIVHTPDLDTKSRQDIKHQVIKVLHPLWPQPSKRITQGKLQEFGLHTHWCLLDWAPPHSPSEEAVSIPPHLSLENLPSPIDPNQNPVVWLHHWEQLWTNMNLQSSDYKWIFQRLEDFFLGKRGISDCLADALIAVPPLKTLVEKHQARFLEGKGQCTILEASPGMGKSRVLLYLAALWKQQHPQGEILVCSNPKFLVKSHWEDLYMLLESPNREIPVLLIIDDLHQSKTTMHEDLQSVRIFDYPNKLKLWWLGGYTRSVQGQGELKIYQDSWLSKLAEGDRPNWEKQWQTWRAYFYTWSQWLAKISGRKYKVVPYREWETITSPWEAIAVTTGKVIEKIRTYFKDLSIGGGSAQDVVYWLLAALFVLQGEQPILITELVKVLKKEPLKEFFEERLGAESTWQETLLGWFREWERPTGVKPRLLPRLPDPQIKGQPQAIDFLHQKLARELWNQNPEELKLIRESLENTFKGLNQGLKILESSMSIRQVVTERRTKTEEKTILLGEMFSRMRVKEEKLIWLDLSCLKLSSLPKEIGTLRTLQKLDLCTNRLIFLPEKFFELTNLQILDLGYNWFVSLPETIGQLTKLEKLDLENNQLTSLPTSFFQLKNLENLNLSYNMFTSLPEMLGNLKNLQALNLHENQLASLPASIGQLKNLRTLILNSNELSSLPASIGQLKNLRTLILETNELSSLPASFFQLKNLEDLDLSYNIFTSLPETLGQLKNLQDLDLKVNLLSSLPATLKWPPNLTYLNLAGNELTSLPASLGDLTKLETLWLDGNQLTSLPASLGNLVNLRTLILASNQLSSLPASIGDLKNLQTLDLQRNNLTSLPASFFQLKNLENLNLSYNMFTSLPEILGNLKSLQTLNLHENQLASLPASFFQLSNLQTFYLTGNKFTSLPASLGQLENLRSLYLHSNRLFSLPASLGQLENLQMLDLRWNQFSSLPASLGDLTKLETLWLDGNQLTSLPASLGNLVNLRTLILASNQLSSLPASLEQLKNLRTLILNSNQLSSLPATIGKLQNLEKLYLRRINLTSLPATFFRLTNLQVLVLEGNKFTSLPETLGQLTKLEKLDLEYNQIVSLPASLGQLENLQNLNLSWNQLSSLPASLGNLTKLENLRLSGNQLTSLPEGMNRLTNLRYLDLRNNPVLAGKAREYSFRSVVQQLLATL
ncbi:MAG: leucine-rich repeat domain-containing protein [Candidatus Hodarchaeota archaeon]